MRCSRTSIFSAKTFFRHFLSFVRQKKHKNNVATSKLLLFSCFYPCIMGTFAVLLCGRLPPGMAPAAMKKQKREEDFMNSFTSAVKSIAKKYNDTSLILRIAIGLVIGAVLALLCPGATWLEELGNLFVGALKGIAPVLVFVIVTSALAQGSSKLDPPFRHSRVALHADHLYRRPPCRSSLAC